MILRVTGRRIDAEPTSVTTRLVAVDGSPNMSSRTSLHNSPTFRFSVFQGLTNRLVGRHSSIVPTQSTRRTDIARHSAAATAQRHFPYRDQRSCYPIGNALRGVPPPGVMPSLARAWLRRSDNMPTRGVGMAPTDSSAMRY